MYVLAREAFGHGHRFAHVERPTPTARSPHMSTASLYSPVTRRQDLEAQNAELRARLDAVLAAVEDPLGDPREDADARLYRRVFGMPDTDYRVDDPNDWPEP